LYADGGIALVGRSGGIRTHDAQSPSQRIILSGRLPLSTPLNDADNGERERSLARQQAVNRTVMPGAAESISRMKVILGQITGRLPAFAASPEDVIGPFQPSSAPADRSRRRRPRRPVRGLVKDCSVQPEADACKVRARSSIVFRRLA
jgi:hypothetical protein